MARIVAVTKLSRGVALQVLSEKLKDEDKISLPIRIAVLHLPAEFMKFISPMRVI